jgi:type VI secretion system secreted protein VgrG
MEQIAIKINGKALQDSILASVEVAQELNQHWWCRVECRQTGDNRPPLEDWLGQDLQVVVSDADGSHTVFDGFVLEGDLRYEVYGSYTASLVSVTSSYKLDLTSEEKYFRKKSLTAIANELAGEDGLSARVQCKDEAVRNYVQWGESDFSFLLRLADDHSCWIRPTKDGIEILDEFQPGSKVQWRGERGLLDFRVRGRLSQPSFKGTHYNPRQMSSRTFVNTKKDAEFSGASARMVSAVQTASQKMPSGALFLDSRAATEEEYERLLQKESVRSIGGKIVAYGTSQNAALKPGDILSVEGVLDANGAYGLTKVIHTWQSRGYRNEFLCTPWKHWTNPVPPQPVEMRGVVTARVVDHNDPRGMGRIQIKYDWQEDGQTGWARMISPHAGADRGFMFMPEKGDEVLVTFEHGDPERPVIIGGLWNGVNAAPRTGFWPDAGATTSAGSHPQPQLQGMQQEKDSLSEIGNAASEHLQPQQQHLAGEPGSHAMQIPNDIANNDIKRIVTKSGNRIQFVDVSGKESIVVGTPGGQTVKLIDACPETGGRKMIALETSGDIFIHAGGRVHIRCQYFSREVG